MNVATVIEHVRHRVVPSARSRVVADTRLLGTVCGRRFLPADPVRDRRSIEHHEGPPQPVTRCSECYS